MNSASKKLFLEGVDLFNRKSFYDAHESWESLWTEYNLDDALLIQGLIQLSVAYFHITNLNLKGSKNLFNKCIPKLEKYRENLRGIDINEIIYTAELALHKINSIDNTNDFDWGLVPKIRISK
tara:strand:+ start:588 stop:956 length:369 start_codon:yes stop_codon:yes gene_type:complete